MTEEMLVQGQRPSAAPYLLGGAVAGAAAGGALAKYANLGVSSQAYSSWEEAINAANKDDEFVKSQAEKKGDNATNWKTIQEQRKKIADAKDALKKASPEGLDLELAELNTYYEKLAALEAPTKEVEKATQAVTAAEQGVTDAEKTVVKAYVEKLKKGEISHEVDGNKLSAEEISNKSEQELTDIVKARSDWKEEAAYKEALTKKAAADEAKKTAEQTKTTAENALKEAQTALNNRVTELNKNITDESKKITLDEAKLKAIGEKKTALKEAESKAKSVLTDDLLSKCKKPSTMITAAIGAVVLGVLATLARPKE